ncbi:hypothetical protein AALP_AA2G138000 [Arabis alpina]|uniref:Uncharacterized protein n=1 Tax=Arabis alpina TaxID=50452 RepID=A0A087HH99_ARAAL|nr:hypothetical protein AALP_AA2G138000 [Arabis alpina]
MMFFYPRFRSSIDPLSMSNRSSKKSSMTGVREQLIQIQVVASCNQKV